MRTLQRWARNIAIGITVACIGLVIVAISQARAQVLFPPGTFDLPILKSEPVPPLLPGNPGQMLQRTYTPLPWQLVMPPPEPLRYPDMSFFGYTTGRIIPRDFLDDKGQTLR